MDTLLLAEIHNLPLWQRRMVLNLIDSRHNRGMGEQLLEVANTVIRDTDSLDFSGLHELL